MFMIQPHSLRDAMAAALGSSFTCNRVGSLPNPWAQQVRNFRAQLSKYNVQLITPNGKKTVKMTDGKSILSQALEANIDVSHQRDCHSGNCLDCIGKRVKGNVNQLEQAVLEPEELDQGFVVLCRALPASDLVIKTNAKKDLLGGGC